MERYFLDEVKEEIEQTIENLKVLRRFDGAPNEFWPLFFKESVKLAGALFGMLMLKENEEWKNFFFWKKEGVKLDRKFDFLERGKVIADAAVSRKYAIEDDSAIKGGDKGKLIAIRIDSAPGHSSGAAVFYLENASSMNTEVLKEIIKLLLMASDIPVSYQRWFEITHKERDVAIFTDTIDLLVLLNQEEKYVAAGMTLCNEVASRYKCLRVSLGWLEGRYIRISAISHIDNFEKKMDAVQALEAAMEEAFEQDEEIVVPKDENTETVQREHEAYSKMYGTAFSVSLPIRLKDDPVGVLTCERENTRFTEDEIKGLRVICDQSARRLGDLKRYDKWIGARIPDICRESFGKLIGFDNTFAKLIGIIIFAALAFLLFGRLTYRVEADYILKTDDLAYMPAPFDGYIYEVDVETGDIVKKDSPLLRLDTMELFIEESNIIADQQRYRREAEKARAQNALADMQIASALEAQASARLKQIRYHLNNASIKAPFAGVVVEGDLKELLGSPVRKGDILFKIAKIEHLYAELNVNERDVHEISEKLTGEISFVSRPHEEFSVLVEKIEPVAIAKDEGNIFIVKCVLTDEKPDWLRPGMSGIAKINVGKRNLLWILTHRTIDFLRMLLWW